MPSNKQAELISRDLLQNYAALQSSIPAHYSTDSYLGQCAEYKEQYCAKFLREYVSGVVVLEEGTEDLMEDLLVFLKRSRHPEIVAIFPEVYKKFKTSVIAKRKQEEKRKTFVATRFKILENKKQAAKLSSDDMIMISGLLQDVTTYSTVRLKDKLRGFADNKINLTLKGEMPADENFDRLVSVFGTYKQKKQLEQFYARNERLAEQKQEADLSGKKKNMGFRFNKGLFKNAWRSVKRVAVVAGIALLGYIGIKSDHGVMSNDRKQNPVEVNTDLQKQLAVSQSKVNKAIDFSKARENMENQTLKQDVSKQDSVKKADTPHQDEVKHKVSAQKNIQTSEAEQVQTETLSLEEAYKESHQASVKLHLGEKKSKTLYNALHRLEKDGKIGFDKGTNLDWYAYSYTMYKVIAPYSDETRLFEDFLNGKPVDKSAINDLVIKAGRNGTGVKGSGSYSAYDNASLQVQKDYKAKRHAVRQAKKALKKQSNNLNKLAGAANGR
ncbi:MAG: hypothetical protein J6C85_06555 [Alphaproteobacteria bacterium]|nr:hypothetical protein [Alphaproteobacteria bacterium]